jgi:hypothetical protein
MTLSQRAIDELARLGDLCAGEPTPASAIRRHTRCGSQNAATEVARLTTWLGIAVDEPLPTAREWLAQLEEKARALVREASVR